MISIYTIELKKIPDNILNIINPIINDLREYQGSISQNEFIDECQSLFDVSLSFFLLFQKLPYHCRRQLLELNKKFEINNNKECTFKPTINEMSKKYAKKQEIDNLNGIRIKNGISEF